MILPLVPHSFGFPAHLYTHINRHSCCKDLGTFSFDTLLKWVGRTKDITLDSDAGFKESFLNNSIVGRWELCFTFNINPPSLIGCTLALLQAFILFGNMHLSFRKFWRCRGGILFAKYWIITSTNFCFKWPSFKRVCS